MAEVKLIRMSSGEDVVANITKQDEKTTTLENPIVAIPTQAGQIGFAPWAPILDKKLKTVDVKNDFIVFIAEADEDIVNQFKKMYGGIISKTSKLIV